MIYSNEILLIISTILQDMVEKDEFNSVLVRNLYETMSTHDPADKDGEFVHTVIGKLIDYYKIKNPKDVADIAVVETNILNFVKELNIIYPISIQFYTGYVAIMAKDSEREKKVDLRIIALKDLFTSTDGAIIDVHKSFVLQQLLTLYTMNSVAYYDDMIETSGKLKEIMDKGTNVFSGS